MCVVVTKTIWKKLFFVLILDFLFFILFAFVTMLMFFFSCYYCQYLYFLDRSVFFFICVHAYAYVFSPFFWFFVFFIILHLFFLISFSPFPQRQRLFLLFIRWYYFAFANLSTPMLFLLSFSSVGTLHSSHKLYHHYSIINF